jgi:hypothetical protein
MGKLDLASKLGIGHLETHYKNTISHNLKNKTVHYHDAKEVYASQDPISPICWQVARSMAGSVFYKWLSKIEEK